jgi:hypothetical protein
VADSLVDKMSAAIGAPTASPPEPAPAPTPLVAKMNAALSTPAPRAGAKPVYEKPKTRDNPLITALKYGDVPLDIYGALGNTRSGHPEIQQLWDLVKAGKIDEANRLYNPNEEENLKRYAEQNPDDIIAQALFKDPAARAIGGLFTEIGNPSNLLAGGVAGRVGGYVARGVGDAATQALRASPGLARGVEAAGNAARTVARPAMPAVRALQRTDANLRALPMKAVLRGARAAGGTAKSLVDRYSAAGLPQRGGERYVSAGLAGQASGENAEAEIRNRFNAIYDGLTPQQKLEVQRLSEHDEEGVYQNARNAAVPDAPKGTRSLETRALLSRALQRRLDRMQVERGLREPGDLKDSGTYAPLRQFQDKPVFASHGANKAASEGEAALIEHLHRTGRGGKFKATLGKTRVQTSPPISQIPDSELHPQYDPAWQLGWHYGPVARAIANEDWRLGLEHVASVDPITGLQRTHSYPGLDPAVDPSLVKTVDFAGREVPAVMPEAITTGQIPTTARSELGHVLRTPEGPLVFGMGEPGRIAKENYIERTARGLGRQRAMADPQVAAAAEQLGVNPRMLGRTVRRQSTAPLAARISEALKGGRGISKLQAQIPNIIQRNVRGVNKAMFPIAQNAQRAATDVVREAQHLADVHAGVRGALPGLQLSAEASRQIASDVEGYLRDIDKAVAGTTKSRVYTIARQMFKSEAGEQLAFEASMRRAIQPDWVYSGGKWKRSGDFDDIPTRFLDLSNKPKAAPAQLGEGNLVARSHGNIDDVATQAGYPDSEALKARLAASVEKPTITSYLPHAERIAQANVRKELTSLGYPESSIAQAQKGLRKMGSDARAQIAKVEQEAYARNFASREYGPRVAASMGAAERTAGRMAQIIHSAAQAADIPERVAGDVLTKATRLENQLLERVISLQTRAGDQQAVNELLDQYRNVFNREYKQVFDAIAPSIRERSTWAPPNFVLESELSDAGSVSAKGKAVDKPFANFIKDSETLRPRDPEEAHRLLQTLAGLNRLARMSVVLVPTVHAVNNLGMHYLAEGGTADGMARILSGRTNFSPKLIQRARTAGAARAYDQSLFQVGSGFNASTAVGSRAAQIAGKIPRTGRVTRGVIAGGLRAERAYNKMNAWLFDTVENGYAYDLFDRFTKAGMTDGAAAMRVRAALGRADNMTAAERYTQLNKIFYFYPWMKTVIPFWVKKGVMDPRWVTGPIRAIRNSNQAQGYDDPSEPFTATLGHRADGSIRRATVPIPQRVLQPIANLARIPWDFTSDPAHGQPAPADALREDALAPANYIMGHFSLPASIALDAALALKGHATERNMFYQPRGATGSDIARTGIEHMVNKVVAPAERFSAGTHDPGAALFGFLAGTTPYSVPTTAQAAQARRLAGKYNARIGRETRALTAAQGRGDDARVQQLEDRIMRAVQQRDERLQALPGR